ncbi:MAG: NAD-dependent epimerase/dehydratase family protein [Flavobacteriales bacterium]|nr:NAD-dependent epimerase/dehydratase family protein [Flavobacteriales bacterium]MCB9449410.1 NAD-dependent epimerase/dehydratase family protein [Flavobacteriales bacterium]
MEKVLIIGSSGQLGEELAEGLRARFGEDRVVCSDIKDPGTGQEMLFEHLDVLDKDRLLEVVQKHGITQIYLLAALLSAVAEKNPAFAWRLNMEGLFNVLDLAKEGRIKKVFWPSSIAVFGPTTPKQQVPQHAITEPNTIYGVGKLAGERWCEYYHNKFGVDVRGIRYPGLIGYKTMPGGGTTDYAVHIFHGALKSHSYASFLKEGSMLPMMYMPDAVHATLSLMDAPADKISIWSSYNVTAMSFTPGELAAGIQKRIPEFVCTYAPDHRQAIADGWPASIDDTVARNDWNWTPGYGLNEMVDDMLTHLPMVLAAHQK